MLKTTRHFVVKMLKKNKFRREGILPTSLTTYIFS
uniref:Uncharacterized protein n=1 Tax=Rhizophora mucronata TaxID=61149 RepID=A0A2P2JGP0_RHIMU